MATKFQQDYRKWIKKAQVDVRLGTKKIAFMLHDRVIERTPVDTGRARASWNMVAGWVPDVSTADEGQRASPAAALAEGLGNRIGEQPDTHYVISNNLPYIEALENGHSKQAPLGMVRLAIADVATRLEIELGGLP